MKKVIPVNENASIKVADLIGHRLDGALLQIVTWAARLGGLMLLVVGLFVLYEVVCRYVFQSPTLWVMDYSIYFVMWAVLLGSAYTMRTRGHVLVDIIIKKLPPASRWFVQIGIHIVIMVFALIVTVAGLHSCVRAYQMKELTLSALYIPLYYPMSSIPVGFCLMALEEFGTICNLVLYTGSDMNQKD